MNDNAQRNNLIAVALLIGLIGIGLAALGGNQTAQFLMTILLIGLMTLAGLIFVVKAGN